MVKIEQTNRSMLFDEINPNKYNLITLIGDVEGLNSLSDDKIEEINKYLLVENFDDFIKKFEPCIYSFYDVNKESINYSLDIPNIPENYITKIYLNRDNNFMNMLLSLIDKRNVDKVKNIDFNYEDILEYISPKKIIQDLKQTRKEIAYLYSKYEALDNNNPEKEEIGDKLNIKFDRASKNYNNVLAMLPLAIDDIETRLSLDGIKSKGSINKIKSGLLSIGDNGNLEVVEISNPIDSIDIPKESFENQNKLASLFKEDYMSTNEHHSEYVSNLVARAFAPINKELVELDVEKEIQNYNSYLNFYKTSQENFIKICKKLVQKILGIKIFFDQYNVKSVNMKPKLLITNISNDILLSSKNKKSLEVYLNTVNSKTDYSETIWFAILPDVNFDKDMEVSSIKKRFKGSINEQSKDNSLIIVKELSNILYKYQIQLFFNFTPKDSTDFKNLSTNGLEKYIDKTKVFQNQVYSEFLSLSVPNFTIIPKNKSKINIGSIASIENNIIKKDNELYFYMDGLYIDASFVAVGLISAMQCPNYLLERFSNVNLNYSGVRINFEDGDNNLKILSTMPKEISGYTVDTKNKINELNFGFVFSSDSALNGNNSVNNISVYKARSFSKGISGSFEPIFKTTTSTYIQRVFRYETNDFKEDRIKDFFSKQPNSQISIWQRESNFINSILKKDDDLSYIIENNTCILNLTLAGNVKHLKLVINKQN